jgi:glucose uptake protein GlcU
MFSTVTGHIFVSSWSKEARLDGGLLALLIIRGGVFFLAGREERQESASSFTLGQTHVAFRELLIATWR